MILLWCLNNFQVHPLDLMRSVTQFMQKTLCSANQNIFKLIKTQHRAPSVARCTWHGISATFSNIHRINVRSASEKRPNRFNCCIDSIWDWVLFHLNIITVFVRCSLLANRCLFSLLFRLLPFWMGNIYGNNRVLYVETGWAWLLHAHRV